MNATVEEPKEKRRLLCALTDAELIEVGHELGKMHRDKRQLEAEKKQVADDYKNRIGGVDSDIDDSSLKLESGKEHRMVECQWKMNFPDVGKKSLMRLDTREVVEEKEMTPQDHQTWLGDEFKRQDDEQEMSDANSKEKPLGLPDPDVKLKKGKGKKKDDGNVIDVETEDGEEGR